MSGNVTTGTETSGPSNPDVQPTVSKLLKGLQGQFDAGVKVNPQPLYPGVSDTTRSNWDTAVDQFAPVAAGQRYGMDDPGFAALRDNVRSDVMRDTNQTFASAGLFGSDSNLDAVGRGLGTALAGLDYTNFQNDRDRQERALGLVGSIGGAQDADMLAQRQAEDDLFRRTNDSGWENLARSSSVLGGTAPYSGTETSKQIPWWQAGLGAATGLAGAFF